MSFAANLQKRLSSLSAFVVKSEIQAVPETFGYFANLHVFWKKH